MILESKNRWQFSREASKVLKKPGDQWIDWCSKLIEYNINPIPMKRWCKHFANRLEFSEKVKDILQEYFKWETQEKLLENQSINIDDFRVKIYSVVAIKEQKYPPKAQSSRFLQLIKCLSKRYEKIKNEYSLKF